MSSGVWLLKSLRARQILTGERRSNHGPETEVCRHEYGPTATKQIIDRVRKPTADECGANIRRRIDQADEEGIAGGIASNAEIGWESQVRTV